MLKVSGLTWLEAERFFRPMRGPERQFQPMKDAQSLPSVLSSTVFWTGWVKMQIQKYFLKALNSNTLAIVNPESATVQEIDACI